MKPESFDRLLEGASVLIHSASPFFIGTSHDPKTELLDPAVQGTQNALEAAKRAKGIRRVVVTSSVASVFGDNQDMQVEGVSAFSEAHWNTSSRLDHQPYQYSKVMAERKAWELAGDAAFDLITINPGLIVGPSLAPDSASGSMEVMSQFLDGTLAMGAPDLEFPLVDVQDVAEAHVKAATWPDLSGRYIIVDRTMSFMHMSRVLSALELKRLPKYTLPKWLVWLAAPFVGQSREMIQKNVGHHIEFDTEKSKHELKLEYRPVARSIKEHVLQLKNSRSSK